MKGSGPNQAKAGKVKRKQCQLTDEAVHLQILSLELFGILIYLHPSMVAAISIVARFFPERPIMSLEPAHCHSSPLCLLRSCPLSNHHSGFEVGFECKLKSPALSPCKLL